MKIAIIVEGKTEQVFKEYLDKFLRKHLEGNMPKIIVVKYDGHIPTKNKLQRIVKNLLSGRCDHVIALTDVYTGITDVNTGKKEFTDAMDAKEKMRKWVGNEPRFHPHAAQYDFEAWLLPYWPYIQKMAGHNKTVPANNPESVDHDKPPSFHIKEIFESGKKRSYIKTRDADKILRENDLSIAISKCSELKALVNTILSVCGGNVIP